MNRTLRLLCAALALVCLPGIGPLFAPPISAQTRVYMAYTGAWVNTTTYNLNDVVTASGIAYVSIQAGNVGNTPASATTFWTPLGAATGSGGSVTINGVTCTIGSTCTIATGSSVTFPTGVLYGNNSTSAPTAATSPQLQTAIGSGVYDAANAAATAQTAALAGAETYSANASNLTSGTVAAARLPGAGATTVNGQSCALGGACTIATGAGADTRPRGTDSVVDITVAASGSCIIASPTNTTGAQNVTSCFTSGSGIGTITNIHLTLGPSGDNANILQNSTLTITCDGIPNTVPIGLFLLTKDNPSPFSNDWIADSLGQSSSGNFSGNRRMEIPYASGCTVTFNNASASSSVLLFAEVDYRVGANVSRPSRQHWHAYAAPLTNLAAFATYQMLPTVTDTNGGELESITLWGSGGSTPYFLEGYPTVTVDGNVAVTGNGTEDFFGSGYNGVNAVGGHTTPKWGEFYASGVGSNPSLQNPSSTYDALLYRLFQTSDEDNALFASSLAVATPFGESTANKPTAPAPGTGSMWGLVTYWTHDPAVAPVAYTPAAGIVSSGTVVTLSTATSGATICSTTDGSYPIANGAGACTHGTAGSSVTVTPPETVTALATKASYADSSPTLAVYSPPASAPTVGATCTSPASGNTPVTTYNCSVTTTTAGQAIVAFVDQPGTISSVTDSLGATAVLATSVTSVGTSPIVTTSAYYFVNVAVGTHVITVNLTASQTYPSMQALVVSGTLASSPVDVYASNWQATASASLTTISITTTVANDLILGHFNQNGISGTWSAGTPAFTLYAGTYGSGETGAYAQTSAGAIAYTATSSVSLQYEGVILALKP